jgi:predicted Zn-ribbon and HTH transcriptional regulator
LGAKLVGKRTIPGNLELSIFNILNIFCHHWFLSVDHLRANALLAQKAENGKFFWVEFTP